jgi:N-acetylmuramoyl-L-alanine amidase
MESNFYVLKHTNCPAVLTENFFQDTKSDVEYLTSDLGFH